MKHLQQLQRSLLHNEKDFVPKNCFQLFILKLLVDFFLIIRAEKGV